MSSLPLTDPGNDVGELYSQLARRLERIVRLDVRAPDPVVEDACQFAWSRLVDHRGNVRRDGALSWLATTAVREAIRMIRRDSRELSLDAPLGHGGAGMPEPTSPGPHELFALAERLEAVSTLPTRQQRVLWLRGLGLSYGEIAAHEGCTRRTVERQLLRARAKLRREGKD